MSYQAVTNPSYQPAMRIITAITNDYPALVTTSFANQYITGTIVRLYIPYNFGMTQANLLTGEITVVNSTQFTIDMDTTLFYPFVIPPSINLPSGPAVQLQFAQVVPVGEDNAILFAATRNVEPLT
jgi:hypothetical protein